MSSPRRLTHSSGRAYLRSIEVSKTQVSVFIEGKTDLPFYTGICDRVFLAKGISYEIRFSREIPDVGEGKGGLLSYFEFLERASALNNEFKGKRTAAVFFVDKDIDDVLMLQKLSDHVVYTRYYDAENHYFAHGDLIRALSMAALLTPGSVRAGLPPTNQEWRKHAAEQWKEWVVLCILTRRYGLSCEANYRVHSKINCGVPYGPLDGTSLAARIADLRKLTGLTVIGFKRVYNKVSRLVDELYSKDRFDEVFKGKWYPYFIVHDARRIAAGRAYATSALEEKIKLGLLMTLDFGAPWADHFKDPLERISLAF